MKKFIAIFTLSFMGLSTQAQRVIEKNIAFTDQEINIEVPFASEIELKTWDKNTVYVKADLTMPEGKYLDLYELNIKEGNSRIEIVSNAEPLFKEWQKDYRQNYPKKAEESDKELKGGRFTYSGDQINITDDMEYTFNYVIYIPEGAEFKISSINGNLNSEVINGNFSADLINGNITIEDYSGDLDLSTINGEINISLGDSNMKAATIHGNIYADETIEFSSTKSMIGQNLERKTGSGASHLQLNTINGNMYLKK